DPALAQLADVWMQQKQPAAAQRRVAAYLAANPGDGHAHEILGAVLDKEGNRGGAEAEFTHAIQLEPALVVSYLQLGRTYQEENRNSEALAVYQKALALRPKFPPLATLIGNLYLQAGDMANARRYFQQALDADPDFGVAAGNLAWVYLHTGQNVDMALSLAQRAKQELPAVDSIDDTLALAYYKKGIYADALPLLRSCIAKEPAVPEYRYHLGLALAASGNRTEARAQFQQALQLKLQGADAQQANVWLAKLK